MATRRMILKEDVESTKWPKLTFRQRYLYWGLSLYADDDGIILMRLVNRFVFEEDEVTKDELEEDLHRLQEADFIGVYKSADQDMCIQILSWWDKQFIDKKIYKTTQLATSKHYLMRPVSLNKGIKPSFYDSSRIPLEQNKRGEKRGNESSLAENNKKEIKDVTDKDGDLPF